MKVRQGDWRNRLGQSRLVRGLGPLLSGLLATALVALTLLVAVVLGVHEQMLVAGVAPSATASLAPTTTIRPLPTVTPATLPTFTPPPTVLPGPSPSPEPSLSPTSEPTASPAAHCEVPSSWELYVVQRGESFRSIALARGITEYQLKQGNCLEATAIAYAGQRIYAPRLQPSCRKATGWVNYVVQKGDTLSSIAARYGLSVARLKLANCRTEDTIYVGETLLVPYLLAPTATTRPRPSDTQMPTHTPTPTPTGEVPGPSVTPTATASEMPGPSPTPSLTLEPTDTSTPPTATNEPTVTAVPPTATPVPTDTSEPPTHTPLPPTHTPLPPPHTPAPTETP